MICPWLEYRALCLHDGLTPVKSLDAGMHLSEGTVVQCSKPAHTEQTPSRSTMTASATVIVLAGPVSDSGPSGGGRAPDPGQALRQTLHNVLSTGLPTLVVTLPEMVAQAQAILPGNHVLALEDDGTGPGQWMGRAIRAGVEASPQAGGWLLLPVTGAPLPAASLHAMADCLPSFPVVHPGPEQTGSKPIGVSGELFSELLRLDSARDLERLASRYPAATVEVAASRRPA